ncbi:MULTISPECIES: tRNA (adenine-N1)-methyltransferase [Auritidibacter]|uniref:tRNA (adenine-N1)-methyltransferase n=1 Tax=Auritidibacter TaxID=1160973 RepID=UPI000D73C90C|nr:MULTISPECIES: tRNA (adenine-N1)-methyltransferase [Auritidibacter]NIH70634.1 tRNA (adenine57-N1/adenine58-N1)-methyltransferase [Auritidibacter ignavus]PXA77807.1 SAM-dependent methyltransferase [Auritidibacter sp. NML100628]PXA81529.1 SAM-dependent methyltransferase [Auritidibacter sp. NML120636]RMX23233.1 tRNA (adenine-N1)-methyltransferase [Auritidibacter ignavus]WGH82130.1 tRNA (adenine-N1)-methyltransferase [Auritidibacter ignavus]
MPYTPCTPGTPRPTGLTARRGPLLAGQRVQLTDEKGKMNTITLVPGEVFHSHQGYLSHDELIGGPDGVVVTNSLGHQYRVLRPLLNDFVLSMPRGATVVYPKDSGQILQQADIYPGARVLEAGAGSGGLTMSLLQAVGDQGQVHSYERREDFADIARGNIETYFAGPHPGWHLHLGDVQTQALADHEPGSFDRVVLDMLAPWECVEMVRELLVPGGVWLTYVATATQLSRTAEAIRESGSFTATRASETMMRDWHVEGLAVRPEHRMIGHTGFLLVTRRMADHQESLQLRKRDKSEKFSDDDIELWTPSDEARWVPEEHGQREAKPKRARKEARAATRYAQHAATAQRTTQVTTQQHSGELGENNTQPPGSTA